MEKLDESEVVEERDLFLRQLLRHLSGTLQDVIGIEGAEGFIANVGQEMGDDFNEKYRLQFGVGKLNLEQVAEALADLKQRIGAEFEVEKQDESEIRLVSHTCPFGEKVLGRPALCMMTSNVFGVVASENLGYANVKIKKAIARGDQGCVVSIFLNPDTDNEGREYFGTD